MSKPLAMVAQKKQKEGRTYMQFLGLAKKTVPDRTHQIGITGAGPLDETLPDEQQRRNADLNGKRGRFLEKNESDFAAEAAVEPASYIQTAPVNAPLQFKLPSAGAATPSAAVRALQPAGAVMPSARALQPAPFAVAVTPSARASQPAAFAGTVVPSARAFQPAPTLASIIKPAGSLIQNVVSAFKAPTQTPSPPPTHFAYVPPYDGRYRVPSYGYRPRTSSSPSRIANLSPSRIANMSPQRMANMSPSRFDTSRKTSNLVTLSNPKLVQFRKTIKAAEVELNKLQRKATLEIRQQIKKIDSAKQKYELMIRSGVLSKPKAKPKGKPKAQPKVPKKVSTDSASSSRSVTSAVVKKAPPKQKKVKKKVSKK